MLGHNYTQWSHQAILSDQEGLSHLEDAWLSLWYISPSRDLWRAFNYYL